MIHLIVGVAAVSLPSRAGAGEPRPGMDQARLPPPDAERDPNRSVDVGNPTSQATTLTWIGYDQYVEHASPRPKDVEQPAVRIEPSGALASGGSGQSAQPAIDPRPAPTPEPSDQPGAQPTVVSQADQLPDLPLDLPPDQPPSDTPENPTEQAVAQTPSPGDPESEAPELVEIGSPELAGPPAAIAVIVETDGIPLGEPVERVAALPSPQSPAPEPPTAQPTPLPPDARAPQLTPQPAPQHAVQPGAPTPIPGDSTIGADAGAPHDSQGRQDTRDADFAAIRAAERVRLGQPVAAKGLRINTVKPRGTHLHSIMAMYTDPVVRVFFDRSGKVRDVKFIRRSQHADVDRYVLNAVFQWTAEGEELLKLPISGPDDTPQMVFVDFVIVRPLSG